MQFPVLHSHIYPSFARRVAPDTPESRGQCSETDPKIGKNLSTDGLSLFAVEKDIVAALSHHDHVVSSKSHPKHASGQKNSQQSEATANSRLFTKESLPDPLEGTDPALTPTGSSPEDATAPITANVQQCHSSRKCFALFITRPLTDPLWHWMLLVTPFNYRQIATANSIVFSHGQDVNRRLDDPLYHVLDLNNNDFQALHSHLCRVVSECARRPHDFKTTLKVDQREGVAQLNVVELAKGYILVPQLVLELTPSPPDVMVSEVVDEFQRIKERTIQAQRNLLNMSNFIFKTNPTLFVMTSSLNHCPTRHPATGYRDFRAQFLKKQMSMAKCESELSETQIFAKVLPVRIHYPTLDEKVADDSVENLILTFWAKSPISSKTPKSYQITLHSNQNPFFHLTSPEITPAAFTDLTSTLRPDLSPVTRLKELGFHAHEGVGGATRVFGDFIEDVKAKNATAHLSVKLDERIISKNYFPASDLKFRSPLGNHGHLWFINLLNNYNHISPSLDTETDVFLVGPNDEITTRTTTTTTSTSVHRETIVTSTSKRAKSSKPSKAVHALNNSMPFRSAQDEKDPQADFESNYTKDAKTFLAFPLPLPQSTQISLAFRPLHGQQGGSLTLTFKPTAPAALQKIIQHKFLQSRRELDHTLARIDTIIKKCRAEKTPRQNLTSNPLDPGQNEWYDRLRQELPDIVSIAEEREALWKTFGDTDTQNGTSRAQSESAPDLVGKGEDEDAGTVMSDVASLSECHERSYPSNSGNHKSSLTPRPSHTGLQSPKISIRRRPNTTQDEFQITLNQSQSRPQPRPTDTNDWFDDVDQLVANLRHKPTSRHASPNRKFSVFPTVGFLERNFKPRDYVTLSKPKSTLNKATEPRGKLSGNWFDYLPNPSTSV